MHSGPFVGVFEGPGASQSHLHVGLECTSECASYLWWAIFPCLVSISALELVWFCGYMDSEWTSRLLRVQASHVCGPLTTADPCG